MTGWCINVGTGPVTVGPHWWGTYCYAATFLHSTMFAACQDLGWKSEARFRAVSSRRVIKGL